MKKWILVMCLAVLGAQAGEELDLESPFLLLSEKKIKTMQELLDSAAREGYHVVSSARSSDKHMHLLLEKQPEEDTAEYRLIDVDDARKLKGALASGAEEGYRLLMSTLMKQGRILGNGRFMAVLEKVRDGSRYEYLVLISTMDSGMQTALGKAAAQNYKVLGLLPDKDDRQIIILQRRN